MLHHHRMSDDLRIAYQSWMKEYRKSTVLAKIISIMNITFGIKYERFDRLEAGIQCISLFRIHLVVRLIPN